MDVNKMKTKVDVKFPCGYEFHIELDAWGVREFDYGEVIPHICPLHGKDCLKEREVSQ